MADELAKVIEQADDAYWESPVETRGEWRDHIAAAVAAHMESPEVVERAAAIVRASWHGLPISKEYGRLLARAAIRAAVQGGE